MCTIYSLLLKKSAKSFSNFSLTKGKDVGLKHYNDSKAFIEHSNDMGNIYENTEEYNSNK